MKEKDYTISLIRLFSLFLIIACHVCQFYQNELAWWLNIGVQVFLLISGFLYGQREIISVKDFYKRNITKILVDYYVFLILIIPIYVLAVHYPISMQNALKLLLGIGTNIPGLGHLWYISTILICYIITPFIVRLFRPRIKPLFVFIVFCLIEVIFVIIPGFTGAWINCYIIGIMIGIEYSKNGNRYNVLKRVLITAAPIGAIVCGSEIFIKYLGAFELTGITAKIANTVFHYGRIALGCILFTGFLLITRKLRIKFSSKTQAVLNFSDKFSYDAYIVHLFCILGPYSFFEGRVTFSEIVLGIVLMIFYIIVTSSILRSLSSQVKRLIKT